MRQAPGGGVDPGAGCASGADTDDCPASGLEGSTAVGDVPPTVGSVAGGCGEVAVAASGTPPEVSVTGGRTVCTSPGRVCSRTPSGATASGFSGGFVVNGSLPSSGSSLASWSG